MEQTVQLSRDGRWWTADHPADWALHLFSTERERTRWLKRQPQSYHPNQLSVNWLPEIFTSPDYTGYKLVFHSCADL